MKIEKLSNKIEFNVEAQKRSCLYDCPGGFAWVNNLSRIDSHGLPTNCRVISVWTSFISPRN